MKIKSLAHYAKGTLQFFNQLLKFVFIHTLRDFRSFSPSIKSTFHLSFTVLVHYRYKEFNRLRRWTPYIQSKFHVFGSTQKYFIQFIIKLKKIQDFHLLGYSLIEFFSFNKT